MGNVTTVEVIPMRWLPIKYWVRNYKTGPIAEWVARMIIRCGNVEYVHTDDIHEATVACGDLVVKFWNSNYPYAWFHQGQVSDRTSGKTLFWWKNQMPDRRTLRLLDEVVERAIDASIQAAIRKAAEPGEVKRA